MLRFLGILYLSFVLCAQAATPVGRRIERLVRHSPAISDGFLGIEAIQLRTGRVLCSSNAHRLFIPASNTKLFTTALALARLGPDYRLQTRIYAAAPPDAAGRIAGDLVLYGGGDPTMSNIQVPYDKDAPAVDSLRGIEDLADRVVASGVRAVDGDIVGDDTAYVWEPYPPSWAVEDVVDSDGAPVSALDLNHNSFAIAVLPGAGPGDPAHLALTPAIEYFAIDNQVVTGAPGSATAVHVERPENSREVRIWGTIAARDTNFSLELSVDDPALYAATALYDALARRGVAVRGRPVARHRAIGAPVAMPPGVVLAERVSPPLAQILQVTDKVSANLWAELMLREVGRHCRDDGSRRGGLAELAAFLNEIGIPPGEYRFSDGSGLSRNVLVSPAAVVQLLAYMDRSNYRTVWRGLLPIGGIDGTLAHRFHGVQEAARIHAKTGSLSHVSALSGYATSRRYGDIAFSILVNNTSAPASDVRAVIDKIGLTLLR
jgi:serine-type D-Ala-D-Ala carboxypeptidase/endopeptidase (penicillin-binding protein 4)